MSLPERLPRKHQRHEAASRIQAETGAAFSEFAIIFPLLFFVFLTFIDFGRFYYYRGLATASAQRGVSLAQVISGLEEINAGNPSQADTDILNAVKVHALTLVHSKMGVPITDDSSEFISILPETGQRPLLILPGVGQGETLEEVLEREPIEISFQLRMRPVSPWLSPMTVTVNAAGYRELTFQSSVPVPVNCRGERITNFNAADPEDCRCPGAPSDPTVWDPTSNTCVCADDTIGSDCSCPEPRAWDPSTGACECPDCPDSQNQVQDADCNCSCPGGTSLDASTNQCGCPAGLEQNDANRCVCPQNLVDACNEENGILAYDENAETIEDMCPCIECPDLERAVDNRCECIPLEEIPNCPVGAEQNADTCSCECPDGFTEQDVSGTSTCVCDESQFTGDGSCDPNEVINSDTCACEDFCVAGETVFTDSNGKPKCCPNPQVFENGQCTCPEGQTADTINGGARCPRNQKFDEATCGCANCPDSQLVNPLNPEDCSCPTTGGDLTQVCTGADEVFQPGQNGTCGCVPCLASDGTPHANPENTACYCKPLADGVDLSTYCPEGRRFNESTCSCVRCRPADGTPDVSDDGKECICRLTEGVSDDDFTGICNNNPNQYYAGNCRCGQCVGKNPNPNATNTGCYCELAEGVTDFTTICTGDGSTFDAQTCECRNCPADPANPVENPTGDGCYCPNNPATGGTNPCTGDGEIFNPEDCLNCARCESTGPAPDANADHTACTCALIDGAGGEATAVCTGGDEVFDAGTCSCETCTEEGFGANDANTSCVCTRSQVDCGDDEIFDSNACDCEPCPEGRTFQNGTCVCENSCDGEDGSAVGSNPDSSCVCACPTGFAIDEGLFGNRCVDERCIDPLTSGQCDANGIWNGNVGE